MRRFLLLRLTIFAGCASAGEPIPTAWLTVPVAGQATLPVRMKPEGNIRVVGNRIFNGEKPLTPRFLAIDSFDLSEERGEVVFSAKRSTNFDIGLVSADGSDIHWIPEDPADEVGVQWAPRGNKVSYIVHKAAADIVRTVHIPTSAQLSVDFPFASVHDLRWDAAGERYSVVVSSPEASERIESMTYEGKSRRVEMPPAARLDVVIEPLAGGIVLRKPTLHYGETLPLIVGIDPDLLDWNDARAALMRSAPVALVVTKSAPDANFWQAVRDVRWIDASHPFVIGATGENANTTYIAPSATIASGHFERRGNALLVDSGRVQSFAAGYVAQQLKGIPPPNGRH